MNTIYGKNIHSKNIFGVGLTALAIGLLIGVGVTKIKAVMPGVSKAAEVTAATTNKVTPTAAEDFGFTGQAWDPFQEINDMQIQMDRMFNQMSAKLRAEPNFSSVAENPAYSLSLNVENLKDRFVVRAYLPDTKISDVNVKLENNHTLKVEASNQQTQASNENNSATRVSEWGQYEQVIQLPAPVKPDRMKIERKDHELLITLPKG